MTISTQMRLDEVDQFDPLALQAASLERSLLSAQDLPSSQGVLLRCLWIHEDERESRVCLALADLTRTLAPSQAAPGIIAQALADRARDRFLSLGAIGAPGFANDFPTSPILINHDVCSVNCAVGFGAGQTAPDLDRALQEALGGMFHAGWHFSRHMRLSEAHGGRVEAMANKLIDRLRAARSRA